MMYKIDDKKKISKDVMQMSRKEIQNEIDNFRNSYIPSVKKKSSECKVKVLW